MQPELGYSPFDSDEADKHRDTNVPKYPIFSGVNDPMVQALAGLFVSCDPCPKGVIGSGAKVTYELLQKYANKSSSELYDALAHNICQMNGSSLKDNTAVLCLADSILYKKTNNGGYVHGTASFGIGMVT